MNATAQKAEPTASPPGQTAVRPWLERELTVVTSRHLKVGWWSLLVFLTMGLVLESLHGFKVGAYLNISNETRRLMWTLAHAHGTLLALVQIAFAFTVRLMPGWPERARGLVSASFIAAGWLMPLGFFLGGLVIYSGDPGLGILLVPVGGLLLLVAVFATARALSRWKVEGAEAKIRKQR